MGVCSFDAIFYVIPPHALIRTAFHLMYSLQTYINIGEPANSSSSGGAVADPSSGARRSLAPAAPAAAAYQSYHHHAQALSSSSSSSTSSAASSTSSNTSSLSSVDLGNYHQSNSNSEAYGGASSSSSSVFIRGGSLADDDSGEIDEEAVLGMIQSKGLKDSTVSFVINVSLAINIVLFVFKVYAFVVSHSMAVAASALDSLLDLLVQVDQPSQTIPLILRFSVGVP